MSTLTMRMNLVGNLDSRCDSAIMTLRECDGSRIIHEQAVTIILAILVSLTVANPVRAYPKPAGDWLILRSLRSKMCLSPFSSEVLG